MKEHKWLKEPKRKNSKDKPIGEYAEDAVKLGAAAVVLGFGVAVLSDVV